MKVVRLVIRLVSVVQEKGEYGESGHRDEAFRDTHHRERHASLSVVRYRETTKHTPQWPFANEGTLTPDCWTC